MARNVKKADARTPLNQLAPMDGIFLSMETPETPAHVGGIAVLDPSTFEDFDFAHFRDFVAERLALCPRFGWRIAQVPLGLDLPYWVDDHEIDYDQHVRRVGLPAPGGPNELADLVGHLYALPLDKSRPLWEMFLIEGLAGGRVALLWKVHHCLMDGESGADLMELLFDISPDPKSRIAGAAQAVDHPTQHETAPSEAPSWRTILDRSMRNAVKRNTKLAQFLLDAATADFDAASLIGLGTAKKEEAEEAPPVPRSSFNGTVSSRRAVAWSAVPLSAVKEVKEQLGVTVNDVLLGLTGGAVRKYLEERGELPEDTLRATVPVSTRQKDDKTVGNQIIDMSVDWATDVADPVERILRIHRDTKRAKTEAAKSGGGLMVAIAEGLAPAAHQLLMQVSTAFIDKAPLPANAVFSNVRMPDMPFYIGGAKIVATIPISVLAPTQGLNITAITYCDEIFFGITADPRLVSDPWILAEASSKSLLDLQAAMKDWSSTVG